MAHFKSVKVLTREGKQILEVAHIPSETTIEEFKKLLIKDSHELSKSNFNEDFVEKKGISINRVWLTVGDARGVVLNDPKKKLSEYSI